MSIENYLNEAIAYVVVRSRFGVTLKPITGFLLTESQTSHAYPSYMGDRIPFKSVSTKLAITLFWWLCFAIAKHNLKLQFDFSTILRQDDGLLGLVPQPNLQDRAIATNHLLI